MRSRPQTRFLAIIALAALLIPIGIGNLAFAQDEPVAAGPSTTRSAETLVYTDTMEDAVSGILSEDSSDPDRLRFEYDDGSFEIESFDEEFAGELSVGPPGNYTDASIAVDAALTDGTGSRPGRYLFVNCRVSADGSGYQLQFFPLTARISISRVDGSDSTDLASTRLEETQPVLQQPHRLQLSCTGEQITAFFDNREILSAVDSAFSEGQLNFGAGVADAAPGLVSASFDNLAVSVPNALAELATPIAVPTETPIDRSALLGAFNELKSSATAVAPLAGPSSGSIVQALGTIQPVGAGVDVGDFYAGATFTNPADAATQKYDYGLIFRANLVGDAYRLIVRSDGTWSLAISSNPALTSGLVERLNLAAGETNTIELVASGGVGYLIINGNFTALLDLQAITGSSDVLVGSGFFADYTVQGAETAYADFSVWGLGESNLTPVASPTQIPSPTSEAIATEAATVPATAVANAPTPTASPQPETPASPSAEDAIAVFQQRKSEATAGTPVFGPTSGQVTQAVGSMDVAFANVDVGSFYTSARFTNPVSATDPNHPWDVLIGFWHTGGDDQIRLIIASDGTWSVAVGSGRPLTSGTIGNLKVGPALGNTVELLVQDLTAYLTINDELVTTVDLPGPPGRGDIWIASGTFTENVQDGVPTKYTDWTVWPLADG